MKKLFEDFKKFAFKGNVIDMAVAVIIGAAFTAVVNSLVNDMLMPIIGFATAGMDLKSMKAVLRPAVLDDAGAVVTKEIAITWGAFVQNIIYFLLVTISIFIIIRIFNRGFERAKRAKEEIAEKLSKNKKKEEAAPPAPAPAPAPDKTELLLTEIRDLLAAQHNEKDKK